MDNFSEILKRRVSPGVLIFDMEGGLLYSNRETLALINGCAEDSAATASHPAVIPEEITLLCQEAKTRNHAVNGSGGAIPHTVLTSASGVLLSARALLIGDQGGDSRSTHIMVLVEKFVGKREMNFEKAGKDYALSRRELEVLKLICQGMSNREISEKMFISEYTVKDHIKKIMEKMRVNSRSEIIVAIK